MSKQLINRDNLMYPLDVDSGGSFDGTPYILFETRPYEVFQSNGVADPSGFSIKIAVPEALNSSDNFTYEEVSLLKSKGAIEALAAGDVVSALGSAAAGFSEFAGDMTSIGSALTGRAINPKQELIFKAPQLRTHSFTFNMFAKNQNEAKVIVDIIKAFRQLSYPAINNEIGTTLYDFPYEFQISMHPKIDNAFPTIRRAFCTSIETNYSGSGRVSLTPNNYFQSIELTLQFQDVRLQDDQSIVGREGF